MLRLTRIADYGVLLMASLAASDKDRLTAAELAQRTHIPQPTVSKILQRLLSGQLLDSVRGAHGGYALMRTAAAISLGEILQCLDHEMALTDCATHGVQCEQQDVCHLGRNWQGINRSIGRVLHSISLADMMAEDFAPEFCLVTQRYPATLPIREDHQRACTTCSGSAIA